ncbi:amino acid adenylation domain-containing protein [Micromonospora peucetia]|uniref:non-ribosomal peptide synthetase n=1 Tax=Micromonospora peucetia TaxID=47871 RepID=UPI00224DEE20|nr:non-ribosomal peptide synthetase [Micromonospora peucetia]MCX4386328.1 amino acid adenylation domain-containing protein [Micromonospora peucetia]
MEAVPAGIPAALCRAVAAHPDRTALVVADDAVTYAELGRRVDAVAVALAGYEVGRGDVVGIRLDRSVDMVVALFGVLRAGAAYVPVDPAHPARRQAAVLAEAGVTLLITEPGTPTGPDVVVPDLAAALRGEVTADADALARLPEITAADLAYVVFTSGTTGRPKGAMVPHGAVLALAGGLLACGAFGPGHDVVAWNASLSFDASVQQWSRLLRGDTVVLLREAERLDPAAFAEVLRTREVTDFDITPTHLRALLPYLDQCGDLRILVGGEAIGDGLWAELAARAGTRAYNVYGPTECTVNAVVARVGAADQPVIGRPLSGVRVRVVDPLLREAGPQELGELLLCGPQVAWGYLGRPAATALAFVPDAGAGPGGRAYRTGDLVRWLPDGVLAYHGRRDQQVKIRGVRIELGEIEHALRRLPGVTDAVALIRDDTVVAGVTGQPDPGAWRAALADVLPAVAVPTDLVVLATLPRNAGGKVDRAAVSALLRTGRTVPVDPAPAGSAAPPMTDRERYVARLWTEVFGARDLSVDSEFAAHGGHSLSAMVVAGRVARETGLAVTVADVLAEPTVGGFAALLDVRPAAPAPPRPAHPVTGARRSAPLAPQQEGLFLLHQMYPHCAAYHVPALLRLHGPVDLDRLDRAVATVLGRHAALRTRVGMVAARPVQLVADPPEAGGLVVADPTSTVENWADEVVRRPFRLDTGPLFRAEVLVTGADTCLLALVGHHIVVDGWSIEVVQRDIGRAYRGESLREPVQFPAVAAAARSPEHRAVVESELAWWRKRLADLPEPVRLPFVRRRPVTPRFRAGRVAHRLPEQVAGELRDLAVRSRVPLFPLLALGLATVLNRYTGQDDLVIGTPVADRDDADLADSVGFYNNSLVLRLAVDRNRSVRDNLRMVAAEVASALAHRHVPFDELVRELAPPRVASANPIFQIWCNLLSYPATPLDLGPGTAVEVLTPPMPGALFDISAYFTDDRDGVGLELVYDLDLFEHDQIEALAVDCVRVLADLPRDAGRLLGDVGRAGASTVRSPWGAYPPVTSSAAELGRTLLAALRRTGNRPAVLAGDGTVTGDGLAAAVVDFATALDRVDPGRRRAVAVLGGRSPALVAALVAVLAGARTFLLVDADLPAVRRERMLAAAGDPIVVDATGDRPVVRLDQATGTPAAPAAAAPVSGTGSLPAGTAYLAFTSGSTGRPRAVAASAAPLAALLQWYPAAYRLTGEDRFSALAGVGHDPLLREVLVAVAVGAPVHLPAASEAASPTALVRWLAVRRITVLHLSPALGRLLVAAGQAAGLRLVDVRLVAFGGGAVDARDVAGVAQLCPGARVVSHYGATETPQVAATIDHGHPRSRETTDSRPLVGPTSPTAEILLTDDDGRPVPVNAVGEIRVRSPYLALGYPGDPTGTAHRFGPDPHGEDGVRVYRTGDLGLARPDGTIEFRGRADRQVSLNGTRVELDEIEAVLREHPDVTDCLVLADEPDGVTAYVAGSPELTGDGLRGHLADLLPATMHPADLRILAAMPLTPNGKPDVAALRAIAAKATVRADGPMVSLVERVCAAALDRDTLGPDVNFFDAGGSSLRLIEVEARLSRALGAPVGLATLFQNPTVRSLAAAIDRVGTKPSREENPR